MKNDDKPAVSRESDKFMLRLPDGMREKIAAAAKESGRSMNTEIVARLETTFSGAQPNIDIAAEFDTLKKQNNKLQSMLNKVILEVFEWHPSEGTMEFEDSEEPKPAGTRKRK